MSALNDADRLYTVSNAFITDAKWQKNKNSTGQVSSLTAVSASGLLGICGAMSCYWIKATFAGDTAANPIAWPSHKLSIAQSYYLRYTNIDIDQAYYELIKIFDLKSAGFQNESLGDCLDDMATKRNARYVLQLNECAEHFTAVWNRSDDFLFFDPERGCYRRTIGDYKAAILGYLKNEYGASSDESVYADHVVDD